MQKVGKSQYIGKLRRQLFVPFLILIALCLMPVRVDAVLCGEC
jgi:hypothetical protein